MSVDPTNARNLARYQNWLQGQFDRLNSRPCKEANGDYLDGWYSPEKIIPDFLTHQQASDLRKSAKLPS